MLNNKAFQERSGNEEVYTPAYAKQVCCGTHVVHAKYIIVGQKSYNYMQRSTFVGDRGT